MTRTPRLLSIVKELLNKPKVCVDVLSALYDVSQRTIQDDFDLLNKHFNHPFYKDGNCYFLLKLEQFYNLFKQNHKTSKQFLRFLSMVDSELYSIFEKENRALIKAMKLDSSTIYQIEKSPYEHLKRENYQLLESLEIFITEKNYLTLYYSLPNKKRELYQHSIPLKILYLGENWYLALLTPDNIIDNSTFKLLRINFIEKVKASTVEPKFFHDDNLAKIEADRFLKNIQSSFSKINTPTYTVTLQVHHSKARYFKNKKYLKSQKVTKTLKNKDIFVVYEISNDMEIIPIIQRWMPFVQVIEPLRVKESIEENLRVYLKGW